MNKFITLNDGVKIPSVGFGVFMIPADGSTYKAVREAIDAGYRHIDTATAYFNEEEVGRAVRDSGIPREENISLFPVSIFVFSCFSRISAKVLSLRFMTAATPEDFPLNPPGTIPLTIFDAKLIHIEYNIIIMESSWVKRQSLL
mgnify:CR=1 FL=1